MSRILQFSISPVQAFVARSRRTRDLLCSSFLLSYLSGQAMLHVIERGGNILFPAVQQKDKIIDRLLVAIENEKLGCKPSEGPWVGSLPNRFQASIPSDFCPTECEKAVQQAWQKMADVIWKNVVAPVASLGKETEQIWRRQTKDFWEIHWVIGEEPDLLRRRKYWRDFIPTKEPGDKCMLFPHLQELSGHTGSGRNVQERRNQQKFWKRLRQRTTTTPKQHRLDLGDTERLSAIGIIKRFLPVYAEEALGWGLPDKVRFFPSTQVLASLPWRKKVLKNAPDQAKQYAKQTSEVFGYTKSAKRFFPKEATHPWVLMDHQAINTVSIEPYPKLKAKFTELCQSVADEPSSYYALLLMDGDRLGDLLQVSSQAEDISQALADFTQSVEAVVTKDEEDYHGVLIYAGGDDVFALFPYDQVLSVAIELRERYLQSFREYAPNVGATISASVVFAHQKTPFQQLIPYAHQQLDDIAKELHGRNSLAMSLYNQTGEIVQWAAPWEKVICSETKKTKLEQLAESLPLSQSFLYQCKQELEPLSAVLPNAELSRVAIGEWERINQKTLIQDHDRIKQLIDLGSFAYTKHDPEKRISKVETLEHRFSADVAHLIRWLRQKDDEV